MHGVLTYRQPLTTGVKDSQHAQRSHKPKSRRSAHRETLSTCVAALERKISVYNSGYPATYFDGLVAKPLEEKCKKG